MEHKVMKSDVTMIEYYMIIVAYGRKTTCLYVTTLNDYKMMKLNDSKITPSSLPSEKTLKLRFLNYIFIFFEICFSYSA